MFKNRKFTLAILSISISSALLVFHNISEKSWVQVMQLVSSAYMGANIISKNISSKKDKSKL